MTKFTRTFSYIDWIFSYDRFFSEKNLTENTKNTDHLVDNSIFPYMNAKFSTHKDISRQEMRDLTSERADQAKDHICDMRDPFEETKQAKRWKTNHDRTGQISPCGDESAPEHDQGTSGSAKVRQQPGKRHASNAHAKYGAVRSVAEQVVAADSRIEVVAEVS